jgi:fibrillarin-like pre-rRNA processing protein
MKSTNIYGVYQKNGKLLTENISTCKGQSVYGEKFYLIKNKEYRYWNPFRSKFAAAIIKGFDKIKINDYSRVLYLGAATGTTISHISDIVKNGEIYAVEFSPIAMKKLLKSCNNRYNIIPIFEDVSHPDRYNNVVPKVDFLYQDISQRNQAEIFISNIKQYLKTESQAIIMIKARSINVSIKPNESYEKVKEDLREAGLKIINQYELYPYEKDHAAIVVTN